MTWLWVSRQSLGVLQKPGYTKAEKLPSEKYAFTSCRYRSKPQNQDSEDNGIIFFKKSLSVTRVPAIKMMEHKSCMFFWLQG